MFLFSEGNLLLHIFYLYFCAYISFPLFLSSASLRDFKIVSLFWWAIHLVPQLWASCMHTSFPKEVRAVNLGIFISLLQWILSTENIPSHIDMCDLYHISLGLGLNCLMRGDRTQNERVTVFNKEHHLHSSTAEHGKPGPEKAIP